VNYLLDTCVISELVSRRANDNVIGWIRNTPEDRCFLSVITIGEIKKGIEKLADTQRKAQLNAWLNDELLVRFKGRLIPLDVDVLLTWGALTAHLESIGRRMPAIDSLIAASAIHADLTLVTRNTSDFAGTAVTLFNPWQRAG